MSRNREKERLREAASYFHIQVTKDGCCMPGPHEGPVQAHHLIPRQALKREGHSDKVYDTRNGAALCELHHVRHERHLLRLPRRLLSPEAFEFAADINLEWLLDREYPDVEAKTDLR